MKTESVTHFSMDASDVGPLVLGRDFAMDELEQAARIAGVGISPAALRVMEQHYAMDTMQTTATTASIAAPAQFLQNWLPGFVTVISAARKADEIVGISTVGSWEDDSIVLQELELTGAPTPYNDLNVVPLASWNANYVQRHVVRFEQGIKVAPLEAARSARANVASDAQKRASAALQLEIQRNAVAFYGYNSGSNMTYGLTNDTNLPSWTTVATVGGHTTWVDKTFLEIQGDLLTAFQALRTQSQDTIEPEKTPITMTISTNRMEYLGKTSDFGISVIKWLKEFYPNVRVVSCPQFNGVNGGANGFMLHADSVNDGFSTDDGRTFVQVVPAKFQMVGAMQTSKGYEEDYVNATAGTMVKRPYAVVRYSGI